MEDQTLLRLALATSLIGLFMLYFASAFVSSPVLALEEITEEKLGKVVMVEGKVLSIREFETSTLVTVSENEKELQVYMPFKIENLDKGNYISVKGEVKEYKGTLEIVPAKSSDIVVLYGSGEN